MGSRCAEVSGVEVKRGSVDVCGKAMTADDADSPPSPWVPLSVRGDEVRRKEFVALREGVPEGAQRSLVEWCGSVYGHRGREHRNELFKLFETATNRRLPDDVFNYTGRWAAELEGDDRLLLDAIDYALLWADEEQRAMLSYILSYGRSVYRLGRGSDDRWELQKTYSDELIELVGATASRPGRAAQHLRIAWSKIAGRQPDPDKACWEATKAVEVAAKSVVSPDDAATTLGRIIGEMGKHPERWVCGLRTAEGIERITDMMRIVWQEGRRHGDESQPIGVTSEAAEIVVQIAVLLVNWFQSGYIRPKRD